ncbi:MAG: DNA repair exonuclease, partial [Clostridiales bacterium]|nr:DNA repair exonuclease [Clostridiales bacterium]
FDKEPLYSLGNIRELVDESVPDYDFDKLYKENSDNILGMFIEKIRESSKDDDVARKALYYGIEALLGAKEK